MNGNRHGYKSPNHLLEGGASIHIQNIHLFQSMLDYARYCSGPVEDF